MNLNSSYVTVGPHDRLRGPNPQPGRLIWNLESPDVHGEFERLKAAGGSPRSRISTTTSSSSSPRTRGSH